MECARLIEKYLAYISNKNNRVFTGDFEYNQIKLTMKREAFTQTKIHLLSFYDAIKSKPVEKFERKQITFNKDIKNNLINKNHSKLDNKETQTSGKLFKVNFSYT